MVYLIINKDKNTPIVCSNVLVVFETTNIAKNKLYYIFSRKKLFVFENDQYRIYKLPIIKRTK